MTFLGGGHWQERKDRDDDGWADLAIYSRGLLRPRFYWDGGNGRTALLTGGMMYEDRSGGTMRGAVLAATEDPYREALDTRRYDFGANAVFHFLTAVEDRQQCVRNVANAVKLGGHVIVSTFGPEGPVKCSGLDVRRYSAEELHHEFDGRFHLVESSEEVHETPFGTPQQFLYCYAASTDKAHTNI